MSRRVVVVDDDAAIRSLFHELLEDEGDDVLCLAGTEDVETIRAFAPDVVVIDLYLEQPARETYYLHSLQSDPSLREVPVVVCSADRASMEQHARPLRSGGYLLLEKPFDIETALRVIQSATCRPAARQGGVTPPHALADDGMPRPGTPSMW